MRATPLSLPALALAACAGAATDTVGGSTDPVALLTSGTTWNVVAIDLAPVPAGIRPTLRRDGQQIGGNGGCNRFGGAVRIAGDRLTIGALVSTRMACSEPAMRVEARLHDALGRVDGARGTPGGTVELTSGDRPVVTLSPAAAP